MQRLAELCAAIEPVNSAAAQAMQRLLDHKTKPVRSLGRLEDLACKLAAIAGSTELPPQSKAIVVMGADHGVAEEGVSAFPQAVTAQMMLNFARGGAAISVLARQAGARVIVVDMGVKGELLDPTGIRSCKIGDGTHSFMRGPAMTREQALAAITAGAELAAELARDGVTMVGIGEMGIGNTTSASALTAVLTASSPDEVTGRGTGIDDATLRRKLAVIRAGLQLNRPIAGDVVDALAKMGGFEIAGLCGLTLGCAAAKVAVVMDGFIASTAALCALRLAPAVAGYLIASHRSVEAGHRLVLEAIGERPLLDLDLRLGEGTGAALALHLCDAAGCIVREMATFEAAGVSERSA